MEFLPIAPHIVLINCYVIYVACDSDGGGSAGGGRGGGVGARGPLLLWPGSRQ